MAVLKRKEKCLLPPGSQGYQQARGGRNGLPEQYLKPNTTYNTGRNGIACPGHILWGIFQNLEKVKYFVCLFARTPPQRARAPRAPDSAPPRGADVGPPAARSRSYRYITTLANPGVQVVPHPHPQAGQNPTPRTPTPQMKAPLKTNTILNQHSFLVV